MFVPSLRAINDSFYNPIQWAHWFLFDFVHTLTAGDDSFYYRKLHCTV